MHSYTEKDLNDLVKIMVEDMAGTPEGYANKISLTVPEDDGLRVIIEVCRLREANV